jgi:hypothetical protein
MEHDIRTLFGKEDFEKKELPRSHQKDFIKKLKNASIKKEKKRNYFSYKVASVLMIIIFGASLYFTLNLQEGETNPPLILVKIENIEKEYIANINKEWDRFLKIAKDTILIKRYEKKLYQYHLNYKKLNLEFQQNPNNSVVLEALIANLQRRFTLIKDIQKHIKALNQKNTSNETIYM